jgi:hypothetical protein
MRPGLRDPEWQPDWIIFPGSRAAKMSSNICGWMATSVNREGGINAVRGRPSKRLDGALIAMHIVDLSRQLYIARRAIRASAGHSRCLEDAHGSLCRFRPRAHLLLP